MFYYLKGELVHRDTNFCVIDFGGVAYRLTVSLSTLSHLVGKDGTTVIVEELFANAKSRSEIIAIFYATLELL